MSRRPQLRALADECGILREFLDADGRRCVATNATREALLGAMGLAASTEAEARESLRELRRDAESRPLDPVRVVRQGSSSARDLIVSLPERLRGRVEWELELREEQGHMKCWGGATSSRGGRLLVRIPRATELPLGYHVVRWRGCRGGTEIEARQNLVVTPPACLSAEQMLGGDRVFGLWANLYTVRSRDNWGIGDFSDLTALIRWGGRIGAAFIGVNPLHALRIHAPAANPYFPASRLFRDPLYLDVTAVPEFPDCPEAKRLFRSKRYEVALARLRSARQLDCRAVMELKRPVLEAMHRRFAARHRDRNSERGRAYREFLRREGKSLDDFATFLALAEHLGDSEAGAMGWRTWPARYRSPDSAATAAFRRAHFAQIDFHRFLQFELDRQLARAAREGRAAGLRGGIYQDLALRNADGSDDWGFASLFASGASLGAPPDAYASQGQDWQLVPIIPRRLQMSGYRYWISLLRNAMRHAGALRIDHAMGLVRQFWIPAGKSPPEGAYVRYPARDLFGILALESQRAGCLVIGEDLGTVPRGFRTQLRKWSVLRSQVLYFERHAPGRFRAAAGYSAQALAAANTHDLPTLAGFWAGRDLELRRRAGQIRDSASFAAACAARERDKKALRRRLRLEGITGRDWDPSSPGSLCGAVTTFLSETRAPAVAVAVDDLGGERDAVNLPGVCLPECPNWSRRMRLTLEELSDNPVVRRALGQIIQQRASPGRGKTRRADPPPAKKGNR